MDKDIVPELLELIKKEFDEKMLDSDKIKNAVNLLKKGQATYKDANEFSIEVGEILAEVLGKNITAEVLPDGKMYFNIADRTINPTMRKNYEIISSYAVDVQTQLNHNAGLSIKGQKAELNQSRIDGIVERLSEEEDFSKIKWILDEPIKNFSQAIIDDTIKRNVKFQAKAGLKPKITRIVVGNCCDWCREIAGTYDYGAEPHDVYRRHRFCRCRVEYTPSGGRRQNVHTKQWQDPEKDAKIEARRKIGTVPKMKLQLFAEKDLGNQGIESLKKGIRNLEKQIKEHKYKITNPGKYYSDWNDVSLEIRRGRIKHWEKEISNFEKSIADRNKMLRRESDE